MVAVLTTMPGSELTAYVAPRPSAITLRRRRLRAVLLVVLLAAAPAWGAARAAAALGDVPASVPERRPGPATYLVQPGDTLWSVARTLRPEGDVRPLVRALVRANGGAALEVGQQLLLP